MSLQITKSEFEDALKELGHNPNDYRGKRLTLGGMCELYELNEDSVLEAIDSQHMAAHYDYHKDVIWIDALDAAHFYYCVRAKADLFAS